MKRAQMSKWDFIILLVIALVVLFVIFAWIARESGLWERILFLIEGIL